MTKKERLRLSGHDVSKYVELRTIAPIMGEILDSDPDMGFAELAKIMNDLGWRNSQGGLVLANSITTALRPVFGDKYRRRTKSNKSKYADRAPRDVKVLSEPLPIDPNGVYIENPNFISVPRDPSEPKSAPTRDSIKTIKPKSQSPKDLLNNLTGSDAEEFLEEYDPWYVQAAEAVKTSKVVTYFKLLMFNLTRLFA